MNSSTQEFADRLRKIREDKRLSKSALARKLGVSTTCVWNWEEGNTFPRPENFKALSEVLNTPLNFLERGYGREPLRLSDSANGEHDVRKNLADVIAEAKERIAKMAGIAPEKVNITLEY